MTRLQIRWRRDRAPLGIWTPAALAASVFTVLFLVLALVPPFTDTERYWLAWLGAQIWDGHGIPRALGLESPLDIGSPWMPTEWLYAVLVEGARRAHLFLLFVAVNAAGIASILWYTVYLCVRLRIRRELSFLIVLCAGMAWGLRFQVRAEDLAWPCLIGILLLLRRADRWRWLVLPLVALWANLHMSVLIAPVVVAIWALRAPREGERWGLFVGVLLALECTPFGPLALWRHAWWFQHSWVPQYAFEWKSAFVCYPTIVLALFIPLLPLALRWPRRPGWVFGYAAWAIMALASIQASRNLAPALAFGVPLACAGFRADATTSITRARWMPAFVVSVALWVLFIVNPMLFSSTAYARDPVFGMLQYRTYPSIVVPQYVHRGDLVYCDVEGPCNIALNLGARTIYDGRMEPFSRARIDLVRRTAKNFAYIRGVPFTVLVPEESNAPSFYGAQWQRRYTSTLMHVYRPAYVTTAPAQLSQR